MEGIRLLAPGRPGPCVVLGHDERPSSPDIVTGVGQMLRRMGCQVVDIGLATRPCLLFAVDHLGAAGAVHVTGAGCDPGWTGLDFVMHGNLPCSSPGALERIAACYRDGYTRPSRRPGSQRTFQASVPYEASMWKHFHALRPLKIALACPSRTVRELFMRVFRKLACRLLIVEMPTRQRSMLDPGDPDLKRTSHHIREGRADLGMLVDDDGERGIFFDEQGVLVPPSIAARLLAMEQNDRDVAGALPVLVSVRGAAAQQCTREAITRVMGERGLRFGADDSGRYWFAEGYPTCDALLTLVHLLQYLSRSDRPFSEVVAAG
jgi:phosphomannomutase